MKIPGSLALKLCLCLVAIAPLAVASTPTLSASPSAVVFQYSLPEPAPFPVFVTITASNAASPTLGVAIAGPSNAPGLFPTPIINGDVIQVYYDQAIFDQLASQPGIYTAMITVTASGFPSPLQIPVTLDVGGELSIIPNPTALSFYVPGPVSQTVALAASGASVGFTVSAATTGGGNWLSVTASQDYTPATLTAAVNNVNIPAGTYQGSITVTPSSGNTTPLVIPVTLQIGPDTITASPTSFSFSYNVGGTAPLPQVWSLGTSLSTDTYVAQAVSSGNWLLINGVTTSVSASLPATLNVTVNPVGLAAGTYQGSITAIDADNESQTATVTLIVTAVSTVANPESMVFVAQYGQKAALPGQPLAILGFGSATYTATVQGSWIGISATSGAAPANLTVTANPAGLQAGTYLGSVTIDVDTHEQVVQVTLIVSPASAPVLMTSIGGLLYTYDGGYLPPAPSTLVVGVSSGSPQTFSYASGLPPWLQISSSSQLTTPQTLTITLTPQIMPTGIYVAQIVLIPAVSTAVPNPVTLVVPVVLMVNNAPAAVPSVTTLNFTATAGQAPQTQNVQIIAASTTAFTAATSATWLSVTPDSATANLATDLTIGADATNLAAGNYQGTVTLTTAGGVISTITVNFTVNPSVAAFGVSPSTLAFAYVQNGSAPASQTVQVTGSESFTAVATTTGGGSWLTVTPASGAGTVTLTVSVSPSALTPGTYNGTITVTPASGTAQTVAVTLTVTTTSTPALTASPTSLSFVYNSGAGLPAAQTVMVASSGQAVTFTATASSSVASPCAGLVAAMCGWLSVTPSSATTPASLSVSVSPGNLGGGSYTGSIVLSGASGTLQLTINVTLSVSIALPTITSVVNAASFLNTNMEIAPGEIITIFGTALGPNTAAFATIQNGYIGTSLAGVQVMFNGYPAPILYASSLQINAIVPYEIAGSTSSVNVESIYGTESSNDMSLQVATSAPGVFSANASGTGSGAILDLNYNLVSASNAVTAGQIIQVFATGQGQTQPAGIDGLIELPSSLPAPLLTTTATIGGVPATVQYAGAAPDLVAGAFQVNLYVPDGLPPGPAQLLIFVGDVSSQPGITVAIQ